MDSINIVWLFESELIMAVGGVVHQRCAVYIIYYTYKPCVVAAGLSSELVRSDLKSGADPLNHLFDWPLIIQMCQ